MGSSQVRTPDGGMVTVEAPGYDLTEPWFVAFRTRPKDGYRVKGPMELRRAFQIGPRGTADSHAQTLLEATVRDRFSFHGGVLWIATAGDAGIAAWSGQWHDLYAFLSGPQQDATSVLDYFSGLTLVDEQLGLRVDANHPGEELHAVALAKYVPETGALQITRAAESAALVPQWAGARVPTGEVWRRASPTGTEQAEELLIHATETAVTVVTPDSDSAVDRRLPFLQNLTRVTWS
jgi:hypothetical protein